MTTVQKDVDEVFLNVRKAYRLLYHYQRRVLDIVQLICSELHFEYENGDPHETKSINHDKKNLNRSAWDFLPLYIYKIQMKPRKVGRKTVSLLIFLQSDSGPYKTDKSLDELSAFESVEKSKSRIHFLLCNKHLDSADYDEFFDDKDIPSKSNNYNSLEYKGGIALIKAFDLCDFINEESAKESLKKLAIRFQKESGVKLPNI
ncbi:MULTISPECIES: hypothetical protein [unclassified Carboxylicivirga]|uniref:hypothetical protein n=1 Tax=Carboxylicivirga TaxID=1628153 RepID=UPI003D3405FC